MIPVQLGCGKAVEAGIDLVVDLDLDVTVPLFELFGVIRFR